MNITKTFSLTPVIKASVVYIEWAAGSSPHDFTMASRWNKFSSKHCSGKDGYGKYYDSMTAAKLVIRAFRTSVLESVPKDKEKPKCKKAATKRQLIEATKMPKDVSLFARAKKDCVVTDKPTGRQPLSIEKLRTLEEVVTRFIDFNQLSCGECCYHLFDGVQEASNELVEKLGRIVGFYNRNNEQPEKDD